MVLHADISTSSSGSSEVVPAASGRRIRVVSYVLFATDPVSVKFRGALDQLRQSGGVSRVVSQSS